MDVLSVFPFFQISIALFVLQSYILVSHSCAAVAVKETTYILSPAGFYS